MNKINISKKERKTQIRNETEKRNEKSKSRLKYKIK